MPTLPMGPLGRTDLQVTRLGFGAMEIRGPRIWGGRQVTPEQAEHILDANGMGAPAVASRRYHPHREKSSTYG